MRYLRAPAVFALALGLIASACGGGPTTTPTTSPGATGAVVSSDPFVLLSTQLNTVTESEALRSQILSGFTAAKVEFRGEAAGPFADRIVAESKVARAPSASIGGLHGDFGALDLNLFEDLTPLATKLQRPRVPRGVHGARQARNDPADLHPVDAGHLHPRRQQAGAAVPPVGSQRRQHHLPAAHAVVQEHLGPDRPQALRSSGRPDVAAPPSDPGLHVSRLHRRSRDDVQVAPRQPRCGRR